MSWAYFIGFFKGRSETPVEEKEIFPDERNGTRDLPFLLNEGNTGLVDGQTQFPYSDFLKSITVNGEGDNRTLTITFEFPSSDELDGFQYDGSLYYELDDGYVLQGISTVFILEPGTATAEPDGGN